MTREDADADGGGMDTARKPRLPEFVRDAGGLDDRGPSDVPMRGDDGRLCVDEDGAETEGAKAGCANEGLGDVL